MGLLDWVGHAVGDAAGFVANPVLDMAFPGASGARRLLDTQNVARGGGSRWGGGGGGDFNSDDTTRMVHRLMESLGRGSDSRAVAHQTLRISRDLPQETRDAMLQQLAASLPQQIIQERLLKRGIGKAPNPYRDAMRSQTQSADWLANKFAKMDAAEAYTLNLARPYLEGIDAQRRPAYAADLEGRILQPQQMSKALVKSLMSEPVLRAFDSQLKALQELQSQGAGSGANPYG